MDVCIYQNLNSQYCCMRFRFALKDVQSGWTPTSGITTCSTCCWCNTQQSAFHDTHANVSCRDHWFRHELSHFRLPIEHRSRLDTLLRDAYSSSLRWDGDSLETKPFSSAVCSGIDEDYTNPNMYYCDPVGERRHRMEGKWKRMFYLTTHSTHFIYGYMALHIW